MERMIAGPAPGALRRTRLRRGYRTLALAGVVSVLLVQSGCVPVALVDPMVNGTLMVADRIHDEHTQASLYANSDFAEVTTGRLPGASLSDPGAAILLVDGQPVDDFGAPYGYFGRAYLRPGPHAVLVRTAATYAGAKFALVEFPVEAGRHYSIMARTTATEGVIQLWDETPGLKSPELVRDFTGTPEIQGFEAALLHFRVQGRNAVLIGDLPSTSGMMGEPRAVDPAADEDVMVQAIDGVECSSMRNLYPLEIAQTRFVAAGSHRVTVDAQRLQGIRLLGKERIPAIGVELEASHVYRLTAERKGDRHDLRLWDESTGVDTRVLVREFHLAGEGRPH